MSQCDRILDFLADGRRHSMEEIHEAVGFCRLNSRISELRKRGHAIHCDRSHSRYVYQLLSSLGETDSRADGGGSPSGPPVAAPHLPQSTNPTVESVSPNEDDEQLSLLDAPRRGAYSEAA